MYKLWNTTDKVIIAQCNDFFKLLAHMNKLIKSGMGQDTDYDIKK